MGYNNDVIGISCFVVVKATQPSVLDGATYSTNGKQQQPGDIPGRKFANVL